MKIIAIDPTGVGLVPTFVPTWIHRGPVGRGMNQVEMMFVDLAAFGGWINAYYMVDFSELRPAPLRAVMRKAVVRNVVRNVARDRLTKERQTLDRRRHTQQGRGRR